MRDSLGRCATTVVTPSGREDQPAYTLGGQLPVASIHREIIVQARPAAVWDALRDIGAIHRRLAPGFVTDVRLEEGARVVTFGNGIVARELIVDIDDQARRLVWSVVGGRMTHHNASAQVFADGDDRSRFVWIADLLPHDLAPTITQMIEQGLAVIKRTLEKPERSGLTSA
jgi:carbon monoxide dehydrogenase subunit G